MEVTGKYRMLLILIAVLIIICVIEGIFIVKNSDLKFFWGVNRDKDFDQFSYSLLDKFKQDKEENWDKFDRFFDDDFFKYRDDPFHDMERMQRQMQEMMEKEFKESFHDSWDGWFNRRFYRKTDDIKIKTEEKRDSYEIVIDIPNLEENKLNVSVDDTGIHIVAEVERIVEKKDSQGNIISSSKVHRKVDQTFPVPDNADYQNAQMAYKKNRVIITLPKLSGK